MEKEKIRGKLLYKGITGRYYDTIAGQKKVSAFLLFLFFIMIILAHCTIQFQWTLAGSSILGAIIWLWFAGIFFFIYYMTGGYELDAIYENGITGTKCSLGDYLTGKSFHLFKNITKIGYGIRVSEGKDTNFIVMYENYANEPTISNYTESDYKNDFYQKLIEILKQKCSNAKWENVDWYSLPSLKK